MWKFSVSLLAFFLKPMLLIGLLIIVVVFVISNSQLSNDISVAIITASATVFVAVFSAVSARNAEKAQQIEQQLREKKTPIYESLIQIAFEVMYESKNKSDEQKNKSATVSSKTTSTDPNPIIQLQKLTPHLIVWGTDRVLKSWVKFREISSEPNKHTPQAIMYALEDVMREIRLDLGLKDNVLKRGNLLGVFINDPAFFQD